MGHFWLFSTAVLQLVVSIDFIEASKYIFASNTDCDRYSLDALYYEKFQPIGEDIFADTTEFVTRTNKLVAESLITIMANLPGRESTNREEFKVHQNFEEMTRRFVKSVNKMRQNITSHWEVLLASNMDLLLDKEHSTLESVRNNVSALYDTYKHTRTSLDASIGSVVTTVKAIIASGLEGIIQTAKSDLLKAKLNSSENSDEKNQNNVDSSEQEVDSELLKAKVKNITSDIVPGFLSKVTLKVFEKRVDLKKEVNLQEDDRDSAFDDLLFDFLMLKTRVLAQTGDDLPKTQEFRDLARRNIYMYWSDLALFMYEEKIKRGNRGATSVGRKEKYEEIWSNEDDLADTLINLMQVYP